MQDKLKLTNRNQALSFSMDNSDPTMVRKWVGPTIKIQLNTYVAYVQIDDFSWFFDPLSEEQRRAVFRKPSPVGRRLAKTVFVGTLQDREKLCKLLLQFVYRVRSC